MSEEQNIEKKLDLKKWGIIGVIAVILIALIVGISIYNSPEDRLERQLELGQRYSEEQDYEQAAISLEQAIAIDDRCIEAYAGGIKAYQALGDTENLTMLYEKALAALETLNENELEVSMDAVVAIYLAADDVYSDNLERAIEILEAGLAKTRNNEQIKEKLAADYPKLANGYVGEADYEKALEIHDRLLELASDNEQVQTDIGRCLQDYINLLIEQGRYDEVKALIEKYHDKIKNVDFQSFLDRIEELERIDAENTAFMQQVYELMAAQYYEAMDFVGGSREAAAFVERMEGDFYIYIPGDDGSQTGIGAGVYKFGERGYYFYYGNVVNGSREGTGISFINYSQGRYDVFTGQWQGDAPNGQGEIRYSSGILDGSGDEFSKIFSGTFVNGLFNGFVDAKIFTGGNLFDVSFTAVNGIVQEDKTNEYFSWLGDEVTLPEGHRIYAYDVIDDYGVWSSCNPNDKLGVAGYSQYADTESE